MNSINIIGTLTRDVELKYLPSGVAVGTFAIAVNQDYKKQDGTKVEKVSFFDIKMIGKQAEIVNQFFHKGSRIAINGELEQETWTAQDGSNRSKVIIKMKEFSFIDRKSDNQGQQSSRNDNQSQDNYQQPQGNYPIIDIDEDEIPFSEVTAPIHNADKFYVKCISCEATFDTDKYDLDLEHDGDICGFCPKCNGSKIFFEVDKNGAYK